MMDCNNTTKYMLRRASLDHRHLRLKIPWKNLRRRVLINRSLIAGVGALLLAVAVTQTTLGVKLVVNCRHHLHYTPCYRSGDPCSSMATPAFFGCAVLFSMLCALACASPRMLAILLFVVTASEIAMGLYQRFSPVSTGSGLFKPFLPPEVILTDLCRQTALEPDAMMHTCWSDLESGFRQCNKLNHTHAILCNLTKTAENMPLTETNFKSGKLTRSEAVPKTDRNWKISSATIRGNLEKCFRDVFAHSGSYFMRFINFTSILEFVCAILHLIIGLAIVLLDQKRRAIKTEIVKRQDAEGLKCPDQNHKRKISREQQRISSHERELVDNMKKDVESVERKISTSRSQNGVARIEDDSEDVVDPRARKHASTGDSPSGNWRPEQIRRKSRSHSREPEDQFLQQKSPQNRRSRNEIPPTVGMGKKRRTNSGDPRRVSTESPVERARHASDGPRRPQRHRDAERTASYPTRPLRTSRDMAVQISPTIFNKELGNSDSNKTVDESNEPRLQNSVPIL